MSEWVDRAVTIGVFMVGGLASGIIGAAAFISKLSTKLELMDAKINAIEKDICKEDLRVEEQIDKMRGRLDEINGIMTQMAKDIAYMRGIMFRGNGEKE